MTWYYVEAGQQAGPVDDAQLVALVNAGRIQADTLVWREGMADWQPYQIVQSGAAPAEATPVAAAAAPVTMGVPEGVCAECNGVFPLHDMIRHGNIYICAKCKPIFMQKLAEGARLNTGVLDYAGFWTRFAAVFLDRIILWVVSRALVMAVGLGTFRTNRNPSSGDLVLLLLVMLMVMAIAVSYETVMVAKYGATLGKMACKIKVVTADGGRVGYPRALGRYFAKILSSIICLIGYIMAAFDDQKRALHDRICDTRVVLK